jgi:hypothetical protein
MFNNVLKFFSILVIIGAIVIPIYLIDINAADGKLTVKKQVKNDCITVTLPSGGTGIMCSGEKRPNDFQMEIYGFINNTYIPLSTFPGDEIGWIVTIPADTQYDVEEIKPAPEGYWQQSEVGDCRGIMLENQNKICTFINTFAAPPTLEFNIGKNSSSP